MCMQKKRAVLDQSIIEEDTIEVSEVLILLHSNKDLSKAILYLLEENKELKKELELLRTLSNSFSMTEKGEGEKVQPDLELASILHKLSDRGVSTWAEDQIRLEQAYAVKGEALDEEISHGVSIIRDAG